MTLHYSETREGLEFVLRRFGATKGSMTDVWWWNGHCYALVEEKGRGWYVEEL